MQISPADEESEGLVSAQIGMHLIIELESHSGETECLECDLVEDSNADYYAGFLSVKTPLGKAVLGQPVGRLEYTEDDMIAIRIITISMSVRQPPKGRAIQREKVIRQAVAESEFKNRLAVATSMGNKWGDLDADGFLLTQPQRDDSEES